jgi:hypothetical protein
MTGLQPSLLYREITWAVGPGCYGPRLWRSPPRPLRLPDAIKLPRLLRDPHVEIHEVEGHGGDVRLDERCAVMVRPHPGLLPQEKVRGESLAELVTRVAAFPLLGERARVRESFNLERLRLPHAVKLPRLLREPHVEVHEVEGHGGDVRREWTGRDGFHAVPDQTLRRASRQDGCSGHADASAWPKSCKGVLAPQGWIRDRVEPVLCSSTAMRVHQRVANSSAGFASGRASSQSYSGTTRAKVGESSPAPP